MVQTWSAAPLMRRVRALIMAGHPIAVVAIAGLTGALAAQAAPHGIGPVLTGPAMLAAQLSVGWSNDASGAPRDAAAGRTDKPIATGAIGARTVWIAAVAALLAALAMSLVIGVPTAIVLTVIICANWAYNLALKSTLGGRSHPLPSFPLPATPPSPRGSHGTRPRGRPCSAWAAISLPCCPISPPTRPPASRAWRSRSPQARGIRPRADVVVEHRWCRRPCCCCRPRAASGSRWPGIVEQARAARTDPQWARPSRSR